MSGPFKMKGSPMKRNFGISPAKTHTKDADGKPIVHKSNIKSTKTGMTNTETGDTYDFKTGETTKNKKGRQKQQRKERARE